MSVVACDAYLIEESCEAPVDELQRVHHVSHTPSWRRVPGMPSLHPLFQLSPISNFNSLSNLSPVSRLLPGLPLPRLARRSALLAPLLLLGPCLSSWGGLLLHDHRPPSKHWGLGGRCRILGLAHFGGGPPPDTLVRLVGHLIGQFVGHGG